MAIIETVYLDTPHLRQVRKGSEILKQGGVAICPTDTFYSLVADLRHKKAVDKIVSIKESIKKKTLSFICEDIKGAAQWVEISNENYRIMKRVLPGPYTFILPVSKGVPRAVVDKRKLIGVRIPNCNFTLSLVEELGAPLLATTLPAKQPEFVDMESCFEEYLPKVDIIFSGGNNYSGFSSIVDLSKLRPEIIREGIGDVGCFK